LAASQGVHPDPCLIAAVAVAEGHIPCVGPQWSALCVLPTILLNINRYSSTPPCESSGHLAADALPLRM